jgi:exodeoxyribonuclease VII small subunit
MSAGAKIGFAEAFEELRVITEKLNGEQVSADELVELLRRGKGLEAALRAHLADVEQEVEAIERGEGVESFVIVSGDGEGG